MHYVLDNTSPKYIDEQQSIAEFDSKSISEESQKLQQSDRCREGVGSVETTTFPSQLIVGETSRELESARKANAPPVGEYLDTASEAYRALPLDSYGGSPVNYQ